LKIYRIPAWFPNVSPHPRHGRLQGDGITSINLDVPAAFTRNSNYLAAARAFAAADRGGPARRARRAARAERAAAVAARKHQSRHRAPGGGVGTLQFGESRAAARRRLLRWRQGLRPPAPDRAPTATYADCSAPSAANRSCCKPAVWDFHHQDLYPDLSLTRTFDPVAAALTTYT